MASGAMLWGVSRLQQRHRPLQELRPRRGPIPTRAKPAKRSSPRRATWQGDARAGVRRAPPRALSAPHLARHPAGRRVRRVRGGGRNIGSQFAEIGLPNPTGSIQRLGEPGRPDLKQSNRGPGAGRRRIPPVFDIRETRLRPTLHVVHGHRTSAAATQRQTGCVACHVVYANDREPTHSLTQRQPGRDGQMATADPAIAGLHPRAAEGHGEERPRPTPSAHRPRRRRRRTHRPRLHLRGSRPPSA